MKSWIKARKDLIIFAVITHSAVFLMAASSYFGDLIVTGPWVDPRAFNGSLVEAITAAQSKGYGVQIWTPINLTSSISTTVPITVKPGGKIVQTGSYTLAINKPFAAGLHQAFDGFSPGQVTFGAGATKEVYPQWWGAYNNNTQASATTAAMQSAFDSGPRVWVPNGTYALTNSGSGDALAIRREGFLLEGESKSGAIFKPDASVYKAIHTDNLGSSTWINSLHLKTFSIDMAAMTDTSDRYALYLKHSYWDIVDHVAVLGVGSNNWDLGSGAAFYATEFRSCRFQRIYLAGTSGSDRVTTLTFTNLDGYYVKLVNALSITLIQPIFQGSPSSKIDLHTVAGLTIMGGDIEGGGVYLNSMDGSNVGIVSKSNNFDGFSGTYSAGTFKASMLWDNYDSSDRYVRLFNGKLVHDETLNKFGFFAAPENGGPSIQFGSAWMGQGNLYGWQSKDGSGNWVPLMYMESDNNLHIGDKTGVTSGSATVIHSKTRTVQITPNDLEIMGVGKGILVYSPDGTKCKRIGIDNAGDLVVTTP